MGRKDAAGRKDAGGARTLWGASTQRRAQRWTGGPRSAPPPPPLPRRRRCTHTPATRGPAGSTLDSARLRYHSARYAMRPPTAHATTIWVTASWGRIDSWRPKCQTLASAVGVARMKVPTHLRGGGRE
jgi:hypothetical protein